MDIVRSGIILNTEKYDDCVAFYQSLIGLPILYQEHRSDSRLTCFENHGAYLMIETGGHARPEGKTAKDSSAKLRFNVSSITTALKTIRDYGIQAEVMEYDWGSVINIHDPDGNRIGIRDELTFKNQLKT